MLMMGSKRRGTQRVLFVHIIMAISMLLPLPMKGGILEIEIPSWITDSMLINGDKIAYDTIRSIIERKNKRMHAKGYDYDIVIFTRNGKIVDLSSEFRIDSSISVNSLMFLPCRGLGWSDTEWNSLVTKWSILYSKIKEIYGYPLHPQLVRVSNIDSVSCPLITPGIAGLYCPPFIARPCRILCDPLPVSPCDFIPFIPKGIIYTSYDSIKPMILSHEMVHAFRGLWIISLYPHYEEGHADAVEVEVANRLGYPHPMIFHSNQYYPFQQFWNQKFIATPNNITFYHSDAVWSNFRYHTSGYLWWKVYKDNPNFFKTFNLILRARPYVIPASWAELYIISSLSATFVEDKPFSGWFANQPMFNILPLPGRYLEIVPTFLPTRNDSIDLYIFDFMRNFLGEEVNINENIQVKIWNSTGDLIQNYVINLDSLDGESGRRYKKIFLNPSCVDTVKFNDKIGTIKYERFKIEISRPQEGASGCSIYDEKYIGLIRVDTPNIPINIGGAVSSELEVNVEIANLDIPGSDTVIRSKCGVFYLIGREEGTYKVSYRSNFAAYRSMVVTKDKAFYHIYPITNSFQQSIPPIRPHGLRVDSVSTNYDGVVMTINIYLRWDRNNDCDTKGYKIYRAIDRGTGPLIFQPIDSTTGTTYHDEVSIIPIDTIYPYIYYFITAYDEDHSIARNESMPSDTILAFPSSIISYNSTFRNNNIGNSSKEGIFLLKQGRKVIIEGKGKVEIYDPSGRLVRELNVNGYKEILLKTGVYMFIVNGYIRKEVIR